MADLVQDYLSDLFKGLPKYIVGAILLSGAAIFVSYKFFEAKEATFAQTIEQKGFVISSLSALAIIWIFVGAISLTRAIARQSIPLDILQIAVANFYGNSETAIAEARGLRTLIRQEVGRRSKKGEPLKLVGELEAPVVSDTEAGKNYGKTVSAHLIVGGDVVALGTAIKFQPLICVVQPFGAEHNIPADPGAIDFRVDAPDHMQLAEASARDIADLISGISGMGCLEREEFDGAIAALSSISRKTSDVWTNMAYAYLYSEPQRFIEAEDSARNAITADSNAGAASNILGTILLNKAIQGEPTVAEAITHLKRAATIPDSKLSATVNLGIAAQLQGDLNGAVKLFLEAAQLKPDSPGALLNVISAYLGAGRAKEAEEIARRTVREHPSLPMAHNLLGRALFQQRRYRNAFDEYRTATQLDDNYAIAYNNMGEAAYHIDKIDDSLAAFSRAIEIDPGYAHAYNNRGYVQMKAGRTTEAERDLKKAIELKAEYPDPWSSLVSLYRRDPKRAEEGEAAFAEYQRLAKLKPSSGAYPVFRTIRH